MSSDLLFLVDFLKSGRFWSFPLFPWHHLPISAPLAAGSTYLLAAGHDTVWAGFIAFCAGCFHSGSSSRAFLWCWHAGCHDNFSANAQQTKLGVWTGGRGRVVSVLLFSGGFCHWGWCWWSRVLKGSGMIRQLNGRIRQLNGRIRQLWFGNYDSATKRSDSDRVDGQMDR